MLGAVDFVECYGPFLFGRQLFHNLFEHTTISAGVSEKFDKLICARLFDCGLEVAFGQENIMTLLVPLQRGSGSYEGQEHHQPKYSIFHALPKILLEQKS